MSTPSDPRDGADFHYMDCGIAGGMPHPASAHKRELTEAELRTELDLAKRVVVCAELLIRIPYEKIHDQIHDECSFTRGMLLAMAENVRAYNALRDARERSSRIQ